MMHVFISSSFEQKTFYGIHFIHEFMTEGKAFKLYGIAEATAPQVNRETNDTLRIFRGESRCVSGGGGMKDPC